MIIFHHKVKTTGFSRWWFSLKFSGHKKISPQGRDFDETIDLDRVRRNYCSRNFRSSCDVQ